MIPLAKALRRATRAFGDHAESALRLALMTPLSRPSTRRTVSRAPFPQPRGEKATVSPSRPMP
jgi:hypothetical protein